MLLCDYAEAVNGKLYISGGGWNRIRSRDAISFSVAIMILVPWGGANLKHRLRLALSSQDGEAVKDPEGKDLMVQGEFEVGRPTGTEPGSDLPNPIAIRMEGLDLDTGGYVFTLEIDGTEVARAPFRVMKQGKG